MEGSKPYAWPFDGDLRPDNTALIVIDMQVYSISSSSSHVHAALRTQC